MALHKAVRDLILVHSTDPDEPSYAVLTFETAGARDFFQSRYNGCRLSNAGITADYQTLSIRNVPPEDPAVFVGRPDLADDEGIGGNRGPERDELRPRQRRSSRARSRSNRRHADHWSSQGDYRDLRTSDLTGRGPDRCGSLCTGCWIGCWRRRVHPMALGPQPQWNLQSDVWKQRQPTAFLTPTSLSLPPVAS